MRRWVDLDQAAPHFTRYETAMSAFFYTCPNFRDFRLLCTSSQSTEGHYILQPCLVCSELHLIDSVTRRIENRPPRVARPARELAPAG